MKKNTKSSSYFNTVLKRLLPAFIISFTIPCVVCILIPFEVFANNLGEFMFAVGDFIPMSLLFTFLFTIAITLAIVFLPGKIYKVACAIIIGIAFMFFLQGLILNSGISSLAGDNLTTAGPSIGQKIGNLIIWIVVLAGFITLALLKDKYGIISALSVMLCIIILIAQLLGPVVLCLNNDKVFASKEDRISSSQENSTPKILTTKGLTTISSNRNVFVFCVDRFDQAYADQGYLEHPEIFEILDGFTAFDDNVSIYGHTFPGITNLLTGNRFDPTVSRETFLESVYTNNQTLDLLNQNGYKIKLFTQSYYAYDDAQYMPSYVENVAEATDFTVASKNKPLLSLSMTQIALYRCFPLFLKNFVGNINSATCNNYVLSEGSDGYSQYTPDMKKVYTQITENTFDVISDKLFSFVHIEGCHGVDYNEEWNKASAKESKDIMISLKNSFKIIGEFIAQLKAYGVYENSTIVITGDHATPINNKAKLSAGALTALFIKPAGSSGSTLAHSLVQASHDDLWATIFQSENITGYQGGYNGEHSVSLFDMYSGVNRTREHIWHTYNVPMGAHTYSVTGEGRTFSNWQLLNTTYYNKFIMD